MRAMAGTSLKQAIEAAMAAAGRGDLETAFRLASAVVEKMPGEPNALQIIGLVHAREGRAQDAIDAFLQAERAAPNHPPILNTLGALFFEKGDHTAAKSYLLRATRLAPQLAQAHRNLAELFSNAGEIEKADAAFRDALKADPKNAESWGAYALFQESRHDLENARKCAERALAINPRQAAAIMALAEIDAREGAHDAVAARLSHALSDASISPVNRAKMNAILARSLEKLGRWSASFAASGSANDTMRVRYAAEMEATPSPRSPQSLARMIEFFEGLDVQDWKPAEGLEGPAPVFSMGFPRSGTTLLDQILSSCEGVIVLEEKVALSDAGTEFIVSEGGLERLPSLSSRDINRLRAAYWKRIEAEIGRKPTDGIFIDKLPLHTVMLGLIWRIFPDAKILFSLRDPRDVVLSCFQQTFSMNVAMYQFLDLASAADYYDKVMRLADICRAKFPFILHEVRYESIVSDFRSEVGAALEFLGLEWNDSVERFAETARGRNISTPSARQVIQGLYSSSAGKWRNYAAELAPVLPVLVPWAKRYGYPQ